MVEIPAGAGPGTVNDAYFRFVVDMGAPGPGKGKGGKYLILPPDYKGDLEGPIGGKEASWIQTVPGKGWFSLLRLYSPTEAWFDKTWKPGDIELVK